MKRQSRAFCALVALPLAAVFACGSGTSAPTVSVSAGWLQHFQEVSQASLQPVNWEKVRPPASPPIAKNKRIVVIPITLAGEGTILQVQGAQDAAKALGWTTQVCNANGSSQGVLTCMLNSMTAKVDGMYMAVVDQAQVGSAIAQANAAGIPIVTSLGGNNVEPDGTIVPGAEPTQVRWDINGNGIQEGYKLASWVIATTSGHAHVVLFEAAQFVNARLRITGMENAFEQCPTCVIYPTVDYDLSTLGQLPLRIQSVLRVHPDINFVGIDVGPFAHFLVEGIKQVGGADKVKLVSYDCVSDQIGRIKAGDVDAACQGVASAALGWAAMDELNRAFNNAPAGKNTIFSQTITAANVNQVTDPTGYTGGFDYVSDYKRLWGIS